MKVSLTSILLSLNHYLFYETMYQAFLPFTRSHTQCIMCVSLEWFTARSSLLLTYKNKVWRVTVFDYLPI